MVWFRQFRAKEQEVKRMFVKMIGMCCRMCMCRLCLMPVVAVCNENCMARSRHGDRPCLFFLARRNLRSLYE